MRARLYRVLKKYAVVLGIGVAYLVFTLCTGWGIPCFFYMLTGYKCPACGVSRMIASLARFDFRVAFEYNPFLLVTGPVILFCFVYSDARYVKTGNASMGRLSFILWAEIAFALAFGIIRNIS